MSMTSRVKLGLTISATALVLCAIFAIAIVVTITGAQKGPETQLEYPIFWNQPSGTGMSVPDDSRIELRQDGTAEVVNILGGKTRAGVDGALPCVEAMATLYSGEATWEIDDSDLLLIKFGQREAVFSSPPDRFVEHDWSSIRESFCGGDYVDYGSGSEYKK